MSGMLKTVFTIDVVCPICGITWTKPIYADVRNDEAVMRLITKPTCCSRACREKLWNKLYFKNSDKESKE